jgi:AcrR family transcriptional regulator
MTGSPDDGVVANAGRETADRLSEAAAALFRERGYEATTTRAIADKLGLKPASLYHHIRSKEELLFVISLESLRRITVAVAGAAYAAAPKDRLEVMIREHVEVALRDRDMHTVMLIELKALSPERQAEVRDGRARYEELFRNAIAEDQAAERVRADIDARDLTLSLLNLLNWTIFWFDPDRDKTSTEMAAMFSTIFFNGVRTPTEGR